MTLITLPFRPITGDPEDVSQIIADLDAILNVVNGDLRDDNISALAAIQASKISAIPGSRIIFSRGTTPPITPSDGDLWQFAADAAAGVYWLFRYNAGSASAHKWEFIGGAPMALDYGGGDTVTASGSYIDSGAALPALARAGDYECSFGARPYFSGTVAWSGFTTVKLGAAGAGDAGAISVHSANPASQGVGSNVSRALRLNGRAAGDVLALWHRTSSAGQAVGFTERWMRLTPVRVS